jgi:hypothetical protein
MVEYETTAASDTRILVLDQEYTRASDTKINAEGLWVGGFELTSPRSRYRLTIAGEGADSESTYHMSDSGTIVYTDNGQHGSGTAHYGNSLTTFHYRAGTFGGSPNGAWTMCGFVKIDDFSPFGYKANLMALYGDTNNHRIAVSVDSFGNFSWERRSKTSSTAGYGGGACNIGQWYFIALGHDPDNNRAFAWRNTTHMYISDAGDYDFTEAGSVTNIGGRSFINNSIDGMMSHVTLYLGKVLTLAEVQSMITYGELILPGGPDSVATISRAGFGDAGSLLDPTETAIQVPDNLVLIEGEIFEPPSDTRIQTLNEIQIGGEEWNSESRIQTLGTEIQIGVEEWNSETAIYGIFDMQIASNTPIKVLGTEIQIGEEVWNSETRMLVTYEQAPTSDTRIKRLTGGIIGKLARTLILNRIDETQTSSTAIFRGAYNDIQLTSGTIIVEFQDFDKTSDTRILKATDLTEVSYTFIIHRTDITPLSDTKIIVVTDIPLDSDTRILKSTDYTLTSDSLILTITDEQLLSSTRIKSSVFIQIWYRSDTTIAVRTDYNRPSVTAIKRASFGEVTATSNTEIIHVTHIQLASQTAIQIQQETSERSQTTIAVRSTLDHTSDTAILGRYEVTATSSTTIVRLDLGTEMTLLSGTRIERPDRPAVEYASSTAIVVSAAIEVTSGTTIKGKTGQYTAVFRKAPGRY